MDSPAAIFTFRWLIRDTFRQALAGRLFWLMLGASGVCHPFCLSLSIEGGQPLLRPGDIELRGGAGSRDRRGAPQGVRRSCNALVQAGQGVKAAGLDALHER